MYLFPGSLRLEQVRLELDIGSSPVWGAMEKHCETCICGKRAPVQASQISKFDGKPRGPGTVAWEEFLIAMGDYMNRYPGQGPERMAQRGGLSYWELEDHLGYQPKTWQPKRND